MAKTKLGKWSIGLILGMVGLFVIGLSLADTLYESVPAGGTILADISSRPALAISMLLGFGAGISAFVTGLISIIKQKERAFLVFLSTFVGAALIIFLIGEFLFPH
jgi:hypothetical protein